MARSRTIRQLEEMIRWQADMMEAELRHTSADIRRALNQSIQAFREKISDNGHPYFLTNFSSTLPVGRAMDPGGSGIPFAWGVLDLSTISPEVIRVYGLDITVSGLNEELDGIQFGERNLYQLGTNQNSIPVAFFGYDETKLGIVPSPDQAYPFSLWYLPKLPDLLEDEDRFNPGVPGAEEWIVWDVFFKLLNRDNYPRLIQPVMMQRDKIMIDILQRASKHIRTGPPKRLDTRGRSRTRRNYAYRHWWVPTL